MSRLGHRFLPAVYELAACPTGSACRHASGKAAYSSQEESTSQAKPFSEMPGELGS